MTKSELGEVISIMVQYIQAYDVREQLQRSREQLTANQKALVDLVKINAVQVPSETATTSPVSLPEASNGVNLSGQVKVKPKAGLVKVLPFTSGNVSPPSAVAVAFGVRQHRTGKVASQLVADGADPFGGPAFNERFHVDTRAADNEGQITSGERLRDESPGEPGVLLQFQLADRFGHVDHLVPDSVHFRCRGLAGTDVHVPVNLPRVG